MHESPRSERVTQNRVVALFRDTFPKIKHDDQVDSTTQALEWAGQPQERYGIVLANSPERIARHQAMESFMGALGASGRSRGW